MFSITALTADDWPVWRELRLAALADAPYAFGSILMDWQGAGDIESRWRSRLDLAGSRNVIAELDGVAVGMASCILDIDSPVAELISMWVAPSARGRGIGDDIIQHLETWARSRRVKQLRLAIRAGNEHAAGLYLRNGFAYEHEPTNMAPAEAAERTMSKDLNTAAPND